MRGGWEEGKEDGREGGKEGGRERKEREGDRGMEVVMIEQVILCTSM